MSENQKLHPQIMLMPPFSEHAPHEEARRSVVPVQNFNYCTFFLLLITFPHASDHRSPLFHKYPKPFTFGKADLTFVLQSPHLAAP